MKKITLLLFSLLFSLNAFAQDAFDRFQFDPEVSYNESVTTPAEYLGNELGEEYTFHHQVMGYLEVLASETDRMTFHTYGTTYEGRALKYAVITSSGNQGRIDEIREANHRLAFQPDADLSDDMPVVVWMSYNVHGNEASSSEAAMQTAYYLAAAENAETGEWLENSVVILDPMINPDGRDRYVYWYKSSQAAVLNTDASDLEHDEIWPGGRTNHYWFDLNRDWVWLVHPESQGRIEAYQQWMPQVHIDFHEQGYNNNYFTMPGTTPRNHELPVEYDFWANEFGLGAIEEFDKAQVNFETRERFDFFYPGYGSSYPSIMGGIGMLAEQGGHSRGGRAVETNDGYVLTLRQRIFDHYKNGLSIVRTSAENRNELLSYFKAARSQQSQKGNTKAYILPDNTDDYTYGVVSLMMKHGVQVERAEENFSVRDARSYWDGEAESRDFKAGDFIIKTDQPAHLFINTLMRRQLEFRDSVMYDMSTWSVPLAYNLDAAWTERNIGVNTQVLDELPEQPAGLMAEAPGYAYVIDWKQRNAPKALAKLWDMGYKVRSAEKGFTKGEEEFSRGSLIILTGRNKEREARIHDDMAEVARNAGVVVRSFDTGRMDSGSDLGSVNNEPLEEPRVALMVDSPFNSYTAGQLWFLFDQWTEFGISRIRTDALGSLNLYDYDVILMPGSWSGLSSSLSESEIDNLKQWVRNGGVLIGTEGSAAWLTKDRSGITSVSLFDEEEEDTSGIDPEAYTLYKDRSDTSGLKRIPGSAFKARIDNSHPLAFGMPETLYSLRFDDDVIKPETGFQTVGYFLKDADEVLASGYSNQENLEKAAGKAFAAVQNMGRGKVVMILDNTQYRMFWVGPSRMIQNAVMLLGAF